MPQYLEEAAALLRKAAEDNEKTNRLWSDGSGSLNSNRERIAMKFAQLAAIEQGLIPPEMLGEIVAQAVRGSRRGGPGGDGYAVHDARVPDCR